MRFLTVAAIATASSALLAITYTLATLPLPAEPIHVTTEPSGVSTHERKANSEALRDAGLKQLALAAAPRVIKTERVEPPPPTAMPDLLPPEVTAPVKPSKREKSNQHRVVNENSDICRGKGKRYYNSKRNWRCRR